jgi:hypothetical protein
VLGGFVFFLFCGVFCFLGGLVYFFGVFVIRRLIM